MQEIAKKIHEGTILEFIMPRRQLNDIDFADEGIINQQEAQSQH